MKNKIKHIIFDVGNVLFDYDPDYITQQLLPNSKHHNFYVKELFLSEYWQKLDRGDYTKRYVIKELMRKFKLSQDQENDLETLIDNFYLHLKLKKDTQEIFEECCQDYNVFIISNFQDKQYEALSKLHPFLTQAKGTVISAKIMMKKPELGIFHYFLTQYRILPQDSIFIDDLKENITTAKRVLINGIQFKSAYQTKRELERFDVKLRCLN